MDTDSVICRNIDVIDNSKRGLLSQNILSQLRNIVEYTILKIYAHENKLSNVDINYSNIAQEKNNTLRKTKKFQNNIVKLQLIKEILYMKILIFHIMIK